MADNGALGELDREVQRKIAAKYNPEHERAVQEWIESVIGEPFGGSDFQDSLKSGVILCNLFNLVIPASIKKISQSNMPFNQMENISKFLNACKDHGMDLVDLFDTNDLYESKNLVAVIDSLRCFAAFARDQSTFSGPYMEGVKYSKGSSASTGSAHKSSSSSSSAHTGPLASRGGVKTDKGVATRGEIIRTPEERKRATDAAAETKASAGDGDDENYVLGGLDRDVAKKIAEKYDPAREEEVKNWIAAVTGIECTGSLQDYLKSGVVLCNLLNTFAPGTIDNISDKKIAFFQRENISKYLEGCRGLGVDGIFDTDQLFENKNIVSVIDHFYSLSRWAKDNSSYSGSFI